MIGYFAPLLFLNQWWFDTMLQIYKMRSSYKQISMSLFSLLVNTWSVIINFMSKIDHFHVFKFPYILSRNMYIILCDYSSFHLLMMMMIIFMSSKCRVQAPFIMYTIFITHVFIQLSRYLFDVFWIIHTENFLFKFSTSHRSAAIHKRHWNTDILLNRTTAVCCYNQFVFYLFTVFMYWRFIY